MKLSSQAHLILPRGKKAASMLIVLVILSAIVISALSFFNVAIKESSISSAASKKVSADLAVRAAFEDAKNLLISQTANDAYFTRIITRKTSGKPRERYTAIIQPGATNLEQVPLVSGALAQTLPMPDIAGVPREEILDNPQVPSSIAFSTTDLDREIEIYGMSDLDPDATPPLTPESRRPEAGVISIPIGNDQTMRYRFWVEDLQGFPNLDVIGAPSDAGNPTQTLYGYSSSDNRIAATSISVPDSKKTAFYRFPETSYGQRSSGQIIPGLNPREIQMFPWNASSRGMTMGNHPFSVVPELLARRNEITTNGAFDAIAPEAENRFVVGLSPYYTIPLIPFGHGYVDEGKPRYSLNRRIREKNLFTEIDDAEGRGLYQIIERNLPDFSDRKGGFPEPDDYLATICANIIDYADTDSDPSLPHTLNKVGDRIFRGVDSYPAVSEVYFKFEYDYIAGPSEYTVRLVGQPFVEFWNPTNQLADIGLLNLDFQFIEDFGFQDPKNGSFKNLREPEGGQYQTSNEPLENGATVSLEPNEYKVVDFGKIEWRIKLPRSSEEQELLISGINDGKKPRGESRGHYKLWSNGHVIQQDSRALEGDRTSPPEHGFVINAMASGSDTDDVSEKMTPTRLEAGTYMMRSAAIGLFTTNSGEASTLGDPWMPHYTNATHDSLYYVRDGSPGARSLRHTKIDPKKVSEERVRDPWLKDIQRVRSWNDGGFESPAGPAPEYPPSSSRKVKLADLPDPDTYQYSPNAALAPFRISNESRYFSTAELGAIHDPVMWMVFPKTTGESTYSNAEKHQRFSQLPGYIPDEADPEYEASAPVDNPAWGGGNTLRIGRAEHPRFDKAGQRASQLLDLFHVGVPGSNLPFVGDATTGYDQYDPSFHQPPPSAPSEAEAETAPYNLVYPSEEHAESIYRKIYGQLNLNSAPTVLEIEALLRNLFATSNVHPTGEDGPFEGPEFAQIDPSDSEAIASHRLAPESIPVIAQRLADLRPYLSPSHLARVVGGLLEENDALPDRHNDAMAEELFARLSNNTTFSSRHFRIFAHGEILDDRTPGIVGARASRVYEVFLRPIRNTDGTIERVTCEVLSVQDL